MTKNIPQYRQIADDIKRQILSGELHHMALLPTEQSVCAQWQVSRITVRKAFSYLEDLGLVSPVAAKKRHVIYQQGDFCDKKFHVVACFGGVDETSPSCNHFITPNYDTLYNALVLELQHLNISFPKVLVSNDSGMPQVARSLNYELAYVLTSIPDELYSQFQVPVIQNMDRYDTRPDLIIRYNTESLLSKLTEDILSLGKKNIFVAYHDINFPFLDRVHNDFYSALKRKGYTGAVRDFTFEEIPDDFLDADCILLDGFGAKYFYDTLTLKQITLPETVSVIAISGDYMSDAPAHCKQIINDNKHIARVTANLIASVLGGKTPEFDVDIIKWYREYGNY